MIRRLFAWTETVVAGIGTFFASQWQQYNPLGQLLFALAMAALVVDAGISWKYGISMTEFHAAGFALVAIAFCILPDAAVQAARMGRKGASFAMTIGCVPLGLVAYQSHIGYSSAVRLGDIQQTDFAHVKLAAAKENLASEKQNIDMLRKKLEEIKARNADARAKSGEWVTSTDPTAAQKQLEALDQKIENEAKRVKCGTKCEALKVERGNLAAYIDNLREEKRIATEIAATQKTIDSKTTVVADTGYKSSTVVNQTDTFAKLYNLAAMRLGWNSLSPEQAIQPTQVQRDVANTAMAGSASLAFMILAPLLMVAAGVNRLPGALGALDQPRRPEETQTAESLIPEPARPLTPHAPTYSIKTRSVADIRSQIASMRAAA